MHHPPKKSNFNEAIQSFRGISIVIVVLFHYTSRLPSEVLFQNGQTIGSFFSFGWIGVYLFFVISGFSIFGSLMRSNDTSLFFAKRIARIFPPFIIASTSIYLFIQIFYVPSFVDGDWSFNAENISFADYFFTTFFFSRDLGFNWVDGVFWTLLVELKFYFWIAIIHALGFTKRLNILNLVLGVVLPVTWFLTICGNYTVIEQVLRVVFLAPYWPFFLLGITIARYKIFNRQVIVLFGVACLSLFTVAATKTGAFENPIKSLLAFAILNGIMIFFVLRKEGRSTAPMLPQVDWKILKVFVFMLMFIGNYSFAWYLLHQKIGLAIVYHASGILPPVAAVVVGIALTLILSFAFSKAVEFRFYQQVQTIAVNNIAMFGNFLKWINRR